MELVVMPLPFGGHLARLVLADGYKLDQWASDGTPGTEINGIPIGAGEAPRGTPLRIVTSARQAIRFVNASNAITTWRDAMAVPR